MILATTQQDDWMTSLGVSRALFLLADHRECDLERISEQLTPGVFDEIYFIDCGAGLNVRNQAESLGMQCITFPAKYQPGRLRKFCFDLARSQGLQLAVMFEVAHNRDLSTLAPLVRLLDDEAWDVIIGSRFEHRAESSRRHKPGRRSFLERWKSALGSFFLGRQFQDAGSDFLAVRTHLLWRIPYQEYQDGNLFDWEFLSELLIVGYRVGEIPVPLEGNTDPEAIGLVSSIRDLMNALSITVRRSCTSMFPTILGYFRRAG